MDLLKDNISKLIVKISYPTMIGMFFNTMFNVVDTYYAGKFETDALAGMSVSFPLFLVLIAFSFGFSSGPTSLVAARYGSGDTKGAREIIINTLVIGMIICVAMIVLGVFGSKAILESIGAEGAVLESALAYIVPLLSVGAFQVFVPLINAPLNAKGFTKYFGNMLVISFFLNLVLDPWFIYGGFGLPAMGIQGVAYATIVVQFITLVFLTYKCANLGLIDLRCLIEKLPSLRTMGQILNQGFPPTVNLLMISVFFFIIQSHLVGYGNETVAAYGIGLRIEQIILIPGIGLSTALLAIGAQNFGAGNMQRLLETRKLGFYFNVSILIAGSVLIFIFGRWIFAFFTNDPAVIDIGVSYLFVECFVLPAYGVFNVYMSIMQAIQKPHVTTYGGIFRHVMLPFLIFPIAVSQFQFDNTQIWWVIFFNNWLVALGIVLYCEYIIHKTLKLRTANIAT